MKVRNLFLKIILGIGSVLSVGVLAYVFKGQFDQKKQSDNQTAAEVESSKVRDAMGMQSDLRVKGAGVLADEADAMKKNAELDQQKEREKIVAASAEKALLEASVAASTTQQATLKNTPVFVAPKTDPIPVAPKKKADKKTKTS